MKGEVCWLVGERCGEKNRRGVGKCVRVWGPNTLFPTLPHISFTSLPSPFPTSLLTPPHPNTLSYTSSHTSSHISPSSPHNPTHFLTPIPTSPSPSESVAKLPCDKVSLAKLPHGQVTGNLINTIVTPTNAVFPLYSFSAC